MKYSTESLSEHAYGRKKTSLSIERRVQAFAELEVREESERLAHSTACKFEISAKSAEVVIRDLLMRRGIEKIRRAAGSERVVDNGARPAGMNDCRIYGKPAEIKTGGAVNYYASADWTEEDVLPGCEYVAFALLEQASEYDDLIEGLCDCTAILPRTEFLGLCEAAARKGIRSTFALKGTTGTALTFQPVPLRKVREAVLQGIESGEYETLEGYLLDRA